MLLESIRFSLGVAVGYSVYPHTLEAKIQQSMQWRWRVISCVLKILWHLLVLGSSICLLLIRRKSSSPSSVLCQLFYQIKLSSWSGISLIRWERANRGVTNLQKLKQWPYSWLKGRRPKIPPGWKELSGCLSVAMATDVFSFLSEMEHSLSHLNKTRPFQEEKAERD